jgi:hypothetical protein
MVKDKSKIVLVLYYEDVWGSEVTAPTFLSSALEGGEGASFTLQPLYSRGKSPHYPMDMKLGGSQSRSGRYGREKPCYRRESNPGRPARNLSLYRLSYPGS